MSTKNTASQLNFSQDTSLIMKSSPSERWNFACTRWI